MCADITHFKVKQMQTYDSEIMFYNIPHRILVLKNMYRLHSANFVFFHKLATFVLSGLVHI